MEYISKNGFKKLKKKLFFLEKIEKKNIIKQLSESLEKGDLSENYEYISIKEAYELLEIKINNFKKKLYNLKIINTKNIKKKKNKKITIFNKVKIKNLNNNKFEKYKIVSEFESNVNKNKISINSPISLSLIGKKVGDKIKIKLPNNNNIIKYKIIKIY
ncbi:MAG: GreA/GreB family elongation factor [Candidatus Shikimatogenerans bostrichidophilus]|nr:MAG: GreA/GreB family elongation factor [Candidatus Shikimatogenerans bostrichidophilus]